MVKKKHKMIDGMPLKTVKALLRSPKTPPHIKDAWRKKLKALG